MDNNVAKGVVHYIDGSCLREGFKNKKNKNSGIFH